MWSHVFSNTQGLIFIGCLGRLTPKSTCSGLFYVSVLSKLSRGLRDRPDWLFSEREISRSDASDEQSETSSEVIRNPLHRQKSLRIYICVSKFLVLLCLFVPVSFPCYM